jgi:NAD-dependent DNA ligase
MTATNRQKKLLRFFGIKFAHNISTGAAGWEIGSIFNDPQNELTWNKYLCLTKDFSNDSDQLAIFDRAELDSLELPQDWSASAAATQFRSDIVASEIADGSPFDSPEPEIEFQGKSFMFTGKFTFGDRSACQGAVEGLGGNAPDTKTVVPEIDYLVIGTDGSKAWKMGAYGNKIEKAILLRRERGTPAIISERHWVEAINNV